MLDTPILDEVCAAALRLAATERPPGTPLTTGRVLAALVRTDITNDWQRIWLYTGDPVALGLAEASDGPASSAPQRWGGVPLSDRLAGALWLLNRIGEAYWLFPCLAARSRSRCWRIRPAAPPARCCARGR